MAEYIDRGTFKESVEERYCKPCKAEGKDHNGCWCRACWVDDMLDEVDCFQPADVAPVVHGRWRYCGFLQECQACGEIYSVHGGNSGKSWNFCPNCGAKMNGGNDNDCQRGDCSF